MSRRRADVDARHVMTRTSERLSAATVLYLVALLGVALAIGPALGLGFVASVTVTAVVALLAHERTVVTHWREAPVRLAGPR